MSFVILSSSDVLYGPSALSTEDSALAQQLVETGTDTSLTLSRRRHGRSGRRDKHDKTERIMRKYEHKLAESKGKGDEKADKIRSKIDYLIEREKERIALNEDTKINFDPNGKSIVFKVEDSPVRVLNKLSSLGYTLMPSAAGNSGGHGGRGHGGFIWTLYKQGCQITPMYPPLLNTTD